MLLLALPPADDLRALATILTQGMVAGLVPAADVFDGRRAAAHFDNVMFTPADPGSPIPWRDGFFSKVYAPALDKISGDVERVLTSGGAAYLGSKVAFKA